MPNFTRQEEFSPQFCKKKSFFALHNVCSFYTGITIIVVAMLVHIELGMATQYAPESVLIQLDEEIDDTVMESSQCYADIISEQVSVTKKPLRKLESIYEYIDSASFSTTNGRGFYLLETTLKEYSGLFEIRIVCYTPDFSGVSYTVVNNTSQTRCSIKDNGKIIVC